MTRSAASALLLLAAAACARTLPEAGPPAVPALDGGPARGEAVGEPNPVEAAEPPSDAGDAVAAAGLAPAALYERCRDRVEGREVAGECASDADCMATGCSGEVCVTKETAAGMMTTCEILPCFGVLDACGCVEGRCTWSVKDAGGAGRPIPVPLPR